MKTTSLFIFLLTILKCFAQNVPQIRINDSTYLELKSLKVESEIVGNIATTSYFMKFYNATDRILEGELAFPLGQGQAVTNFSMDVNGEMRNAVIVEKELGRVAYENTIRQQIDPGLLEVTKGNNYKARVYPIPARGVKELRIEFEQELFISNKKHIYEIPFNFKNPLDFELQITIYGEHQKYKIIEGGNLDLRFKTEKAVHYAEVNKKNWLANQSLKIELPVNNNENIITYSNYFNVYKVIEPKPRLKVKPDHITIFWDASHSMKYRNLDAEIDLLDDYFNYLDVVSVDFISFSNSVQSSKTFKIKNGNWKDLKSEINSVIYDGGTSYSLLNNKNGAFSNINLKNKETNEILFFTDGMFNLGDLNNNCNAPVNTINAVKSANHEFLTNKANELGGKYINLKITEPKQAFEALKYESYQFLGITDNEFISEVYPRKGEHVRTHFSIAGRFKAATQIELLFGYGNSVTEKLIVNIDSGLQNKLAKRLWAKKKLSYLNRNKEKNKAEIIKLAKKNHLITAYTSMIILDRLEDYVRYNIEPPKELRKDFKQRIQHLADEDSDKLEEIKDMRNDLLNVYKDLMNWYSTDYPIALVKPKKDSTVIANRTEQTERFQQPEVDNQNTPNVSEEHLQNRIEQRNDENLNLNTRIISGIITDESGLPLPGVNITVSGNSQVIVSDFNGNYKINAGTGDILNYSYIGFLSKAITVHTSDNISFSMTEDSNALDEVVITGYGVTKKAELTSSVTSIKSESVSQLIQGRVSGITIQNNDNSENETNVVIRGVSSVSKDTPIYIVDGKVASGDVTNEMSSDAIESVHLLKAESATALYGSRGANGVIIITTKEGVKFNSERIQELNKKVDEAIQFKVWTPEANYLKQLATTKTVEEAYNLYLEIRKDYYNTPTFFIDVADFFDSKNERQIAIKVLSNLAEMDLDNHEVLRALAYKLEYFESHDLALYIYKEVLNLRPEEPQSTRDLALAYENVGEYQKAFDLLFKIINGDLLEKDLDRRFHGIEQLAYVEAGHLVRLYKDKLNLNDYQKELIKPFTIDLRVTADWNHNNTDLDLYVENPKETIISYKNRTTNYGDRLSEDMTEGYGPEEYLIKKALSGEYAIELDYYSDEVQKISGPTVVKITIFKNYGKKDETREIRIYRLEKEKEELEIGSILF